MSQCKIYVVILKIRFSVLNLIKILGETLVTFPKLVILVVLGPLQETGLLHLAHFDLKADTRI